MNDNNQKFSLFLRFLPEIEPQRKKQDCVCLKLERQGEIHYGRFALSPFEKGEAEIVGMALKKSLLNLRSTFISEVTFFGIATTHNLENTNLANTFIDPNALRIPGFKEELSEILKNFQSVLIRNMNHHEIEASISVSGPKEVIASDIQFVNKDVFIVNPNLYLFSVVEPKQVSLHLFIEKDFSITETDFSLNENETDFSLIDSDESPNSYSDLMNEKEKVGSSFDIEPGSRPVEKVNYTIHPLEGNEKFETLVLSISTNKTLFPEEALMKAAVRNMGKFTIMLRKYPSVRDHMLYHFKILLNETKPKKDPGNGTVVNGIVTRVNGIVHSKLFESAPFVASLRNFIFSRVTGSVFFYEEEELSRLIREDPESVPILAKLDKILEKTKYLDFEFQMHKLPIEEFRWTYFAYFHLIDSNFQLAKDILADISYDNLKKTKHLPYLVKRDIWDFIKDFLNDYCFLFNIF